MNNTEHIELENREIWLIDQNSIKAYEHEQGKLEGKLEANLATAKRLYVKGFTLKEISETVDLSEGVIQKELGLGKQL